MATNGSYATLEQLRSSSAVGNLPAGSSWGYEYRIEVEGAGHFVVTATPTNPGANLPTLSVDETMQISQN